LDQRGKELYGRCSKLSKSLAHLRRCANDMFLTVNQGIY
jgi:hypothetical protein